MKHGPRMGIQSVSDYDRSAHDTIQNGIRFTYTYADPRTPHLEEQRVGYYDRRTALFAAVSSDDTIILSHFDAPERYVRNLKDSTFV